MASEEQYLDDLLKNVLGNEPPKERTMEEVMREMGAIVDAPASDVPDTTETIEQANDTAALAASDFAQKVEIAATDQDALADMLDVLDDPSVFSADVLPADIAIPEPIPTEPVSEDAPEIRIPDEQELVREAMAVDTDIAAANLSQDDLEAMLDGMDSITPDMMPAEDAGEVSEAGESAEETVSEFEYVPEDEPATEEIPTEEPTVEVPVVEEPAVEETTAEEPVIEEPTAEEPVIEEPAVEEPTQDDLASMLAGMTDADPNAKMSDDDIATMFAAAAGAESASEPATEETIAEEAVVEEPTSEEPVAEKPVIEEPTAEEPTQDDLASMLAGMTDADPNAKMSDDDIAAMFAAAAGAESASEPATEETIAEEPVAEEPTQDELASMLAGMTDADPNAKMSDDDIAAMFAAAAGAESASEPATEETIAEEAVVEEPVVEEPVAEKPVIEDPTVEEPTQDDLASMLAGLSDAEPTSDSNETTSTDDELLKMLGEATTAEDFDMPEDRLTTDTGDDAESDAELSQDDLESMLAGIDGVDSEDSETGGETAEELSDVEKLDATEGSDEDLLSLLEGIDENITEEEKGLPEELSGVIGDDESSDEQDDPKAKKKKKFSLGALLPFGKKKKKAKGDEESTEESDDVSGAETGDEPIAVGAEQIDDILAGIDDNPESGDDAEIAGDGNEGAQEGEASDDAIKQKNGKKDKKPGFFAKLFAFMFEEVEEADETLGEDVSNEDILAQIDAESAEEDTDKGKGKKGKKAKKDKKKKGKGKEEPKEGEEESEGTEEGADTKKKKKPKKEKAPKEPKEKEPRKVVLSKKASVGLVAFCATLVAAIVIISNILPEHAEKLNARRAFFAGDYRTVYEELHGKRLGDSDYLLYKKAQTILLLQRRLDSYQNRLLLGEPAQALDSLLEGVYLHDQLVAEDRYGVATELNAINDRILAILSADYGLSKDDALRIYLMDDANAYTDELIRIVSGGNYKIVNKKSEMPEDSGSAPEDGMIQDDISDEISGQENTPDDTLPPSEDIIINEDGQVFTELHPLEDLLDAEEDL